MNDFLSIEREGLEAGVLSIIFSSGLIVASSRAMISRVWLPVGNFPCVLVWLAFWWLWLVLASSRAMISRVWLPVGNFPCVLLYLVV